MTYVDNSRNLPPFFTPNLNVDLYFIQRKLGVKLEHRENEEIRVL